MNWNDLKMFSRDELMDMVPEGFEFKTLPWTHQISAFLATISNDGFLSCLDLGVGKTKVAIDTCRYYDLINGGKKNLKVLYVCLHTAIEKMRDEVETHSDFSAVCVKGSKAERWEMFSQDHNFYIINYEGLRSIITERVLWKEKHFYDEKTKEMKSKKVKREVIDDRKISKLKHLNFDVIILDESHMIKNSKSLVFRIIKKILPGIKYRILLTGTPFGNSLIDVWSQYYIVDKGETFYPTFSLFRSAYFEDKGWFGPLWEPTEEGEKIINEKLYNKALRYNEDEVDDLPKKVFRVLEYSLTKRQRAAYDSLIDDDYDSLTVEVRSKALAFREIASGFIADSNHIFKTNPKLDLLWDLIENVHEKHKVVVFVERTMSRKIIEKMLKKNKIPFRSLSGESKDKYLEYNTFQKDPKYRVIVAQIKTGGASIDLTAATYCIHWEHGGSVINFRQSLKRIHRGGQTKRCFFYSLIGKGTVERSIYKDLMNNNDAFQNIVDGEHAKAYLLGG